MYLCLPGGADPSYVGGGALSVVPYPGWYGGGDSASAPYSWPKACNAQQVTIHISDRI